MDVTQTHQHIQQLIDSSKPFLVGRPGGTESVGLHFFLKHRIHSLHKNPPAYPNSYRRLVKLGPGVTHNSSSDLDYFNMKYLEATLSANVIGFGQFAPGALRIVDMLRESGVKITAIERLEPFVAHSQSVAPWTESLAGRRVLIIHPFAESIESQFAKRESISGVSEIMPECDLQVLRAPVTFAGEESDKPWRFHFKQLVADTQALEFDIAVIGAGSYGLPIAHEIVKNGKQAIHLGGSLQLLFGIRGKRWEGASPYSDYMDDTWVRPSPSEIPQGSNKVEGGAYW